MSLKRKKPSVVGLFSGCGGLDLGFKQAGFNILWANDFDQDSVTTYRENIGDHITLGDITKIPSKDIPSNFDVLLGGFPCQGFSVANKKRSVKDERNFLYLEMKRIIKDKKPKFFVAENVKGILSLGKGAVMEMIINDFRKIGYKVDYRLLTASDYGIPQHRQRVFIIGNRIGKENPYPKITHGLKNDLFNPKLQPFLTTKDAIGHLASVRTRDKPFRHKNITIYNHVARMNVSDKFWGRKHDINQFDICDYLKKWREGSGWSTKKIDDYFGYAHTAGHWFRKDNNSGSIPNPDDWRELKRLLKFDNKYDKQVTELEEKKIVFEQSLRISNWEEPSDTITATGPEIHPNKKRRLSVRECAILQTFPDDFVFHGAIGSMYKQIGNAVAVDLAYALAKLIKKAL